MSARLSDPVVIVASFVCSIVLSWSKSVLFTNLRITSAAVRPWVSVQAVFETTVVDASLVLAGKADSFLSHVGVTLSEKRLSSKWSYAGR